MLIVRGMPTDPQSQVGCAGDAAQALNQCRNDAETGLYAHRWQSSGPRVRPSRQIARSCRKVKNVHLDASGGDESTHQTKPLSAQETTPKD